jgi:hypothetical protein
MIRERAIAKAGNCNSKSRNPLALMSRFSAAASAVGAIKTRIGSTVKPMKKKAELPDERDAG